MTHRFYKSLKVERIRKGSGIYRAATQESAEQEIKAIKEAGGRAEHDWIEIWVEGGGLFLTQKFKSGIEFDEYLYKDDSCDEFQN